MADSGAGLDVADSGAGLDVVDSAGGLATVDSAGGLATVDSAGGLEAALVSIDTPTGTPAHGRVAGLWSRETAATLTAGACVFFDRPRRPFLLMTSRSPEPLFPREATSIAHRAGAHQRPRDSRAENRWVSLAAPPTLFR